MVDPYIHTPLDGRGPREVRVDGKVMERVTFADTRRGIVRYCRSPIRLDQRGDRIIEATRRGKVEVKPLDG